MRSSQLSGSSLLSCVRVDCLKSVWSASETALTVCSLKPQKSYKCCYARRNMRDIHQYAFQLFKSRLLWWKWTVYSSVPASQCWHANKSVQTTEKNVVLWAAVKHTWPPTWRRASKLRLLQTVPPMGDELVNFSVLPTHPSANQWSAVDYSAVNWALERIRLQPFIYFQTRCVSDFSSTFKKKKRRKKKLASVWNWL